MKIITSAVIGVIIIVAAYAITAFVMDRVYSSVGGGSDEYSTPESASTTGQECRNLGGWCTPMSECFTLPDPHAQTRQSQGRIDCEPGEACCAYVEEIY